MESALREPENMKLKGINAGTGIGYEQSEQLDVEPAK